MPGWALGGLFWTYLHFILSLVCWIRFTVLYLWCAEAKLITGTSTVADTAALIWLEMAPLVKSMLTCAWNTDVRLGNKLHKHCRPFLHDTYLTELPWFLLFMQSWLHWPLSQGRVKEKRCLWTFYPLQNWLSGIWGMDFHWQGLSSSKIFRAKCKYVLKVIVLVVLFCKLMYSILLHSLGWWHQSHWMCSQFVPAVCVCLCKVACLICSFDSFVSLSVCSLCRSVGLYRVLIVPVEVQSIDRLSVVLLNLVHSKLSG